ncbi:MAG TPA: AAA family ATPase [Candidatus Acidoferrales bacterium]|jgi:ATP-dependent exoDNAse (exonuclease V) alpha subunit|nr:AAA family ATPase [Candidatus Acidoferrales bacterium]
MSTTLPSAPLRHLSIRVPWHDAGWAGLVCLAPHLNGACAKLKGIASSKNEETEKLIAGRSLEDLRVDQWPCCVGERATFMAPFEMEQIKKHALAKVNAKNYGHFQPTRQRCPAFSAGIVPFRWMMREFMSGYRDLYELDVDEDREPDLGYDSPWVHEVFNQQSLLNGFASHVRKDDSLCFFYAKYVPFVEGTGRILIGAGRVKEILSLKEYDRRGDGPRGMLWERPVQHSIRPNGKDGFLLPYYDLLKRKEADPTIDIERFTARAPDDHWDEFSFGSELVTHDGAIAAMLSLETAFHRQESELGIASDWQRQWIHDELIRLWKVRGPFPGLGAVLASFGLSRGIYVAHALQQKAGENVDPWPLVDKAFKSPDSVLGKELHTDLKELATTWKGLTQERKAYLRLLSRFELTKDQAAALYEEGSRRKENWSATDHEILQNPYLIFEISRHDPEGVHLLTIDRGVFPEDVIRLQHQLEKPSRLESAVDMRRIRAFSVDALEEMALNGHTLASKNEVVDAIVSLPVRPACPVNGDILTARIGKMAPEISGTQMDGQLALQLDRYRAIGELVRRNVEGRIGGKRHEVPHNWARLLEKKFGPSTDKEELRARKEKAAALKEIAEARFSVLAGAAGAGKTTVLGILCSQPEIKDGGILLLAPTGKARVRMQQLIGGNETKAFTIAQFLYQQDRYDGSSGRYILTDGPKVSGFGTVIVDESSMLTEDMLGALFDALKAVKRFIFVGDPAQIPPIGAGRPFLDIISKLRPPNYEVRFPRVGPGYAELTIERRQIGFDRPDLRLARWFSSTPPAPGEDDIFVADPDEHETIRFVQWDKSEDFQSKLISVLETELQLSGPNDFRGFNKALGAVQSGGYDYFNATRNGNPGSVAAVEAWQILSPLRGMPFGVGDINRLIHEHFRADYLKLAMEPMFRRIPKPMGPERVVYGDKVINLRNHRRDGKRVYPKDGALGYLANGEIGIAVGLWGKSPKILNVEFSSQQGFSYSFYGSDFRDEGEAALELAYALTVHKAQGSQFKLVILVLPEGHPILSRELIYTALTRHQDRVVVMHQGPRTIMKDFAAPQRSEIARRRTNLLQACRMLEFPQTKGSVFLQEGLIHRTSKGLAVRSKSELIIAEALSNAGIEFEYEKPLSLGGSPRYPDFTIDDEISGRVVFWEHLGMLERADYKRSWEKKLAWYRSNGVLPAEEGAGPNGMLVTTTESSSAGFDSAAVQNVIRKFLNP